MSIFVAVSSTDLLLMFLRNALVVRSIDLTVTLTRGVMGELACFKGLKLRMLDIILLATAGRERTRRDKQFKVPSTKTTSLDNSMSGVAKPCGKGADLMLS